MPPARAAGSKQIQGTPEGRKEAKMIKQIIKEVSSEGNDFGIYFDDDGIKGLEDCGGFNTTLFVLYYEGWGRFEGFNIESFREVQQTAGQVWDAITDIIAGYKDNYRSCKEVMDDYGIAYSPKRCSLLKKWAAEADGFNGSPELIADYLSITTGRPWTTVRACGYSQGDVVTVLYCEDHYSKEGAQAYGEVWLGAATEYCITFLNDDGSEDYTVYGFIIADCRIKNWADRYKQVKQIVCEWEGIKEEETELQMIDGRHTYTVYDYKTVA